MNETDSTAFECTKCGSVRNIASPLRRLLAFIIDKLIAVLVIFFVINITFIETPDLFDNSQFLLVIYIFTTVITLKNGVYIYSSINKNAVLSPGKQIMKIEIQDKNGGIVGTRRQIIRFIFSFISLITLGAGYLPAIFSSNYRTLADRIAGTVAVVKERSSIGK